MKSSEPVMQFPRRQLRPMAPIRQKLPSEHIEDVSAEVSRKLRESGIVAKIRPGHRIAITAGSRGIGGLLELLSGIAETIRSQGGEPFIIPAMGSHGGATPEGQAEILRRLGVSEQAVRAPIRATMETCELGTASNHALAHVDRLAFEADGIIVLGVRRLTRNLWDLSRRDCSKCAP